MAHVATGSGFPFRPVQLPTTRALPFTNVRPPKLKPPGDDQFLTMAQEHDLHFLAMRDKSHLVDFIAEMSCAWSCGVAGLTNKSFMTNHRRWAGLRALTVLLLHYRTHPELVRCSDLFWVARRP